jgi:hypothetical protein
VQTFAVFGDVIEELILHAALPEFLNVVKHARYRFFPGETGEIQRDLVRVVNHQLSPHALVAGDLGGQALGFAVVLLPLGFLAHGPNLDCGHFVFGATGRPVGEIRCDDVGA